MKKLILFTVVVLIALAIQAQTLHTVTNTAFKRGESIRYKVYYDAILTGKVNAGESTLEAAKREIGEETGITELTLLKDLGEYERYSIAKDGVSEVKEWGLRKRTLFLFTTTQTDTEPLLQDGEITDKRWVTIDEAIELLTHPKDKEFLASVRTKIEDALK